MIEICAGVLHVSIYYALFKLLVAHNSELPHSNRRSCFNFLFLLLFLSLTFFCALLLNSFPSFIIFRFCSFTSYLDRLGCLFSMLCYLFVHYFLVEFFILVPERIHLFRFFVVSPLMHSLFCREYLDVNCFSYFMFAVIAVTINLDIIKPKKCFMQTDRY